MTRTSHLYQRCKPITNKNIGKNLLKGEVKDYPATGGAKEVRPCCEAGCEMSAWNNTQDENDRLAAAHFVHPRWKAYGAECNRRRD